MALAYITSLRNTRLDAITTAIGASGRLRIYDGTRPATGGTATALGADLPLAATFAGAASIGVLTASGVPLSANASASITATWGRLTTSGGTAIVDFNVGTSGSDLNLTTTTIISGQPVSVSSFVITEGNP